MRYGIQPTSAPERLALLLDLAPKPVLDMLVPLVKTRAIMSAVRFGIFEALANGSSTAEDLAKRCQVDAECLQLLLRVLSSTDYVESRGSHFTLTALGKASFAARGNGEYRGYVEFNYTQWQFVEQLDVVLQRGRGIDFHDTLPAGSPSWADYQRAMLELARPVAPLIAKTVPVPPGARRLLDLGGSHGLIGASICRAHPPLRSTVIELPAAAEPARALAIREGIADVVDHEAGNALHTNLGSDIDVILLSNLLHHLTISDTELVMRRAFAALRPSGTLAVWETELPSASARPELASDALALYFCLTSSAPSVDASGIAKQLHAAGLREVRAVRFWRAPGRVLIVARRPQR